MIYDCIVVGAGPAGGSAAYHLAKQGRAVLVLEKALLPRYKPCAGGVSPIIAEWFDFDFTPVISLRIDAVRYTWNLGDPVESRLEQAEPIWMVRRDVFDQFLVQQAQRQGATLRDQTEVIGLTFYHDHWQVQLAPDALGNILPPVAGRYLIAADGAKGNMAKLLGFPPRQRRLYAAIEAEAPIQHPEPKAHFEFGLVKNGYLWNFPKADGYSIGICNVPGGKPQNLRQLVTDYAQRAFGVDFTRITQYGHPICTWDAPQQLHTQQALLAGEAACVVDPFTAEGIRPSIFSGIKAAAAIDQALTGDRQALEHYTAIINQDWGGEMIWAKRLAQLFYRVPSLGYRLGVKQPSANRRMVNVLCGQEQYSSVAQTAIKKLSAGLLTGNS
jgi:geranylgeranyl reductase family protein